MHGSPSTRRTHRRRRRARRAVSVTRRVRHRMRKSTRAGIFSASDLGCAETCVTRSKPRRKARPPSAAVRTPSRASRLRPDVDVDVDRRAREADRPPVARRASRPRAPGRRVRPRPRLFRPAMEHGQDPLRRGKNGPQGGREVTVRANPDVHFCLRVERSRARESIRDRSASTVTPNPRRGPDPRRWIAFGEEAKSSPGASRAAVVGFSTVSLESEFARVAKARGRVRASSPAPSPRAISRNDDRAMLSTRLTSPAPTPARAPPGSPRVVSSLVRRPRPRRRRRRRRRPQRVGPRDVREHGPRLRLLRLRGRLGE